MSLITANSSRRPQCIKFLLPLTIAPLQTSHFSSTSRYSPSSPRLSRPRGRAPQAAEQQQQQSQSGHSNPQVTSSSFYPKSTQWPSQILQEAARSGKMAISAKVAEAVLDDFQRLRSQSVSDKGKICSEHSIQPVDLTKLAKVLMNFWASADTKIIRNLLSAASELQDPSSTLIILKTALIYGSKMPLARLQHMKQMVSGKNYAALYVQGQIYEAEKNDSLALKMYMESLSSAAEGYPGAEAFDITLGEVWLGIYRSKSRKNDNEGAHTAIKRAALEYDEPYAYYVLARDYTPQTSKEYEIYMLKAAASGEMRAADALGNHYLEQSQGIQLYFSKESLDNLVKKLAGEAREAKDSGTASQRSPSAANKSRSGLNSAREWFNLGAEAEIASSQVHLAVILRNEGKSGEGFNWLEKARTKKGWPNTITWLEKHWKSDNVDFLQVNIENLRLLLDGTGQKIRRFS